MSGGAGSHLSTNWQTEFYWIIQVEISWELHQRGVKTVPQYTHHLPPSTGGGGSRCWRTENPSRNERHPAQLPHSQGPGLLPRPSHIQTREVWGLAPKLLVCPLFCRTEELYRAEVSWPINNWIGGSSFMFQICPDGRKNHLNNNPEKVWCCGYFEFKPCSSIGRVGFKTKEWTAC